MDRPHAPCHRNDALGGEDKITHSRKPLLYEEPKKEQKDKYVTSLEEYRRPDKKENLSISMGIS